MALGRPLGAKLFLEGMEVPFIGATITSAVNQAAITYIDVVPHYSINDIKPRTLVQLFVRDYMNEGGSSNTPQFPYVLAWQGEVFGYTMGKTPTSRSFSLSCIDPSSYWDCVMAYYFNAMQSLGAAASDKTAQANEMADVISQNIKVISETITQESFFIQKIKEVINSTKNVNDATRKKDFLDGFVALYEYIGYVNEFFRNANYRLRISDQIVLHSSKKLIGLLEEGQALEWFMGIPGKSTGYATLRSVIQDLMSLIFHDCVSTVFPSAVNHPNDFSALDPRAAHKGLPHPENTRKTIGTFIFKPNLYMMPPPCCNIFFPDEYSSFQYSRNFFKEPTRLIYVPELPARFGTGAAAVYLPHVYEPPSLSHYMLGKGDFSKFQKGRDTDIPKKVSPGHLGDSSPDPENRLDNGKKRIWFFLTNEEQIKGIWMARENMMPATTQFKASLDDASYRSAFSQRVARYLFYKKRFQDRTLQITSHLKMSVVAGFPVLLLDQSAADQNIIAYCSSVTHRIYATEGGYTNVQLSYARLVTEQDTSSNYGIQLLIPPWFEETIFGTVTQPPESESAKEEVASLGAQHVAPEKLSDFYKTLLGSGSGGQSLTSRYKKEKTLLGSTRALLTEYKKKQVTGTRDVQAFIASVTARDYVKLRDAFTFMGATTKVKDIENNSWIEFTGIGLTSRGNSDEEAIALRRKVIKKYRDILKEQRGFRG